MRRHHCDADSMGKKDKTKLREVTRGQ